ncbi:MAG: hypothetical protein ACO23N_00595 [Opitutales bacterium]
MTLAAAYVAQAVFLALVAGLLLADSRLLRSVRRSGLAGVVLAGSAVALLGWHLWHLPEPDLAGFPRLPVTVIFVGAGLAAFVWMPDLIAVRGLGALMLFLARACLDAGWMRLPDSLLCAAVSYALLIIPGLWWAASPGAFATHVDWVLATSGRRGVIGGALGLVAIACALAAWGVPAA